MRLLIPSKIEFIRFRVWFGTKQAHIVSFVSTWAHMSPTKRGESDYIYFQNSIKQTIRLIIYEDFCHFNKVIVIGKKTQKRFFKFI